jgi:hypothetical protein
MKLSGILARLGVGKFVQQLGIRYAFSLHRKNWYSVADHLIVAVNRDLLCGDRCILISRKWYIVL